MALDAELSNLKSAGTYRFERDLSTISNDTTSYSNLRLIVGFSKVGPFNTPTLVTNPAQFVKLYGQIDRSLEKRGSFFHRSCLVALSAGPILCLNLLNLDPDIDQVPQKSFSINTKYFNKPLVTLPLISIYDTDKFWFPSEQSYIDSIERYLSKNSSRELLVGDSTNVSNYDYESGRNNGDYTGNILHFVNVGKKPVSILVKKASSYATTGYECTLNEWYGEENVPEYLNGTSYVSDYMVEVYVVGGDFGPATKKSKGIPTVVDLDDDGEAEIIYRYDEDENPYSRFTSDIVYQEYFDENGFIRKDKESDTTDTKLTRFLNLSSVNLIGKYTGSLIPNFVSKFGQNIWIQKLVNDDTTTNGVMCVENVENLENVEVMNSFVNENIDIIGHNIPAMLFNATDKTDELDINFLSYKTKVKTPRQELYFNVEINNDTSLIEDASSDGYIVYARNTQKDSEIDPENPTNMKRYWWKLDKLVIEKGSFQGEYQADGKITINGEDIPVVEYISNVGTGDGKFTEDIYTYESNYSIGTALNKVSVFNKFNNQITGISKISYENNPMVTDIAIFDGGRVIYDNIPFTIDQLHTTSKIDSPTITLRGNEVLVPVGSNIVAGDYVISYMDKAVNEDDDPTGEYTFSRLTRVVDTRGVYADTSDESEEPLRLTKVAIKVVCADVITKDEDVTGSSDDGGKYIKKFKTIDKYADHLQWISLKGYQIREELMPNGTNERQNEILDLLREEPMFNGTKSNLFATLCDRDYIQWRYLIDTFGCGIEEECKNVYTLLCKKRQSALAIVNCPSQTDFKKSTDPSFVNIRNSVEAEFIAQGGDPSKTPSFRFSLPTEQNGASYGAYYYPYLKISDLSATKSVPPAAYVSNLYMAKYNSSNAWSIVAGQRRGVISGNQVIGVEATLVHDNRDWLEPVGINSIIWENGVGVEVYANKTAKQTPKSALSSVHVRECCIYIQDNVESILRRYIFEMNTAQTRLEIKTLVDNFLETVKADSGIYEYKTVMDTTNNTQEVIDNNQGVIDIYIEPVRGLEILTQRLTVMKTGGIAAGSFE